jgi:hypothetical protein
VAPLVADSSKKYCVPADSINVFEKLKAPVAAAPLVSVPDASVSHTEFDDVSRMAVFAELA